MNLKKIDGSHFEGMIKNGYANICNHSEELNRLNVFPVADGDTGTNMRLTLGNGIKESISTRQSGAFLKRVSDGMLLGARGNSGVILSQLFKGMFLELSHCGSVNVGELRNSLIRAYVTAYSAVPRPVEGTVLTVAREGIEHIRNQINRSTTIDNLLSLYLLEMKKSLAKTPEILPELKEAGVVDSGALGYIYIIEGMLKYLYGEIIEIREKETFEPAKEVNLSFFNENSSFEEGYCMEFILQLMRDPRYIQRFNLNSFINDLKELGNSLVVVQDGKRVKVHMHTFKPSRIISMCQEYGEFLTFKLENMQLQHNEMIENVKENKEHKPLSIITVANGEGFKDIFKGFDVDMVIDGGEKMNASTNDFIEAFKLMNSDSIVVLPNNKNLIGVVNQAIELSEIENVKVIPTENMVECYYALGMDIQDSKDVDYRISQMELGYKSVTTISISKAVKEFKKDSLLINTGDYVGLVNNAVASGDADIEETVVSAFKSIDNINDMESCLLFKGIGISSDKTSSLIKRLEEEFPDMEFNVLDGNQFIYDWLIGVC